MSKEKLVPVDEDLYNELQDAYQDLEKDIIRATEWEYGNEGIDPSVAEQVLLTLDKVLTAYDYYSEEDSDDRPSSVTLPPIRPMRKKKQQPVDVSGKVKV